MSEYKDFELDIRSNTGASDPASPASVFTLGAVCTFSYTWCVEISLTVCDTVVTYLSCNGGSCHFSWDGTCSATCGSGELCR